MVNKFVEKRACTPESTFFFTNIILDTRTFETIRQVSFSPLDYLFSKSQI